MLLVHEGLPQRLQARTLRVATAGIHLARRNDQTLVMTVVAKLLLQLLLRPARHLVAAHGSVYCLRFDSIIIAHEHADIVLVVTLLSRVVRLVLLQWILHLGRRCHLAHAGRLPQVRRVPCAQPISLMPCKRDLALCVQIAARVLPRVPCFGIHT